MERIQTGWAVLDRKGKPQTLVHRTRAAAIDEAEDCAGLYWWWLEQRRGWTVNRVAVYRTAKATSK